ELAGSADVALARRAQALAAQLRAMGTSLVATSPAASQPGSPAATELADDVKALADGAETAPQLARLRRAGVSAIPALQDRLRKDRGRTPDAVVRLLGLLGRGLGPEARCELRDQIALRHRETWSSPTFSTMSPGPDPTPLDREIYGDLVV